MDYKKAEKIVGFMEKTTPQEVHMPARNLLNRLYDMNKYKGTGINGADNYYHRLAMCENAQMGYAEALVSLLGGVAKEGYDTYCKTFGKCDQPKIGLVKALQDSGKDMKNNIEGLTLGLQNPEISCKLLLQDLDWETNTWKKPRK